jgi:hypothetical protein
MPLTCRGGTQHTPVRAFTGEFCMHTRRRGTRPVEAAHSGASRAVKFTGYGCRRGSCPVAFRAGLATLRARVTCAFWCVEVCAGRARRLRRDPIDLPDRGSLRCLETHRCNRRLQHKEVGAWSALHSRPTPHVNARQRSHSTRGIARRSRHARPCQRARGACSRVAHESAPLPVEWRPPRPRFEPIFVAIDRRASGRPRFRIDMRVLLTRS